MASVCPDRPPLSGPAGHAGGSGNAPPAGPDSEAGFIAVEWVAAIVLLLIPMVLLGAGVSRWPERQQVARAAAAEGARAAVLSDTQALAVANPNRVADEVAANYGVPAGELTVRVDAATWDWGEDVTVTVTVAIPALDIPGVGSWSPGEWSTAATQRIEDYRGLE